ncbi:hypothetical protein ACVWYQ_006395 [Bradyrhizobium sp. USDA 3397]
MTAAVELHIGELVLDGIEGDGRGVAQAIERELTRLIGERGLPALYKAQGAHAALTARRISLRNQPSAQTIGSAVAEALYSAEPQGNTRR